MPSSLFGAGASKVIVTVLPSPVTPVAAPPRASVQIPAVSADGYFFAASIVNTTSSTVNGLPSLHFTPSLICRTRVCGSRHS